MALGPGVYTCDCDSSAMGSSPVHPGNWYGVEYDGGTNVRGDENTSSVWLFLTVADRSYSI